jgi:hypothetical protein
MANKKITELPAANLPIVAGVKFEAVQGGVNVQVDADDMPGSGGGSGVVETIVAGTNITVDDTDPANPIVSASGSVASDWGDIGGTLADQTDLNTALLARQLLVNSATALTDAGTIDLTAIKHTLTTSSSRTFTISYTGDDISIEVTLSATSATQTFPATSLCVSEGVASGTNTLAMAGVSGDKYIIAIKKVGSAYYVVCKNFGQ